jgi:LPXTG-motif cell wall-anchored protein
MTATCNGHPVRLTRLPRTGVSVTQQLAVGLGLLLIGLLLLAVGGRPSGGAPARRRRRPPVKVYAQ